MGSGVLFYGSTIHNIYIKSKCFFLLSKTTFPKCCFHFSGKNKTRKEERRERGNKRKEEEKGQQKRRQEGGKS